MRLVLALLAVLSAGPASGQSELTGGDLASLCKERREAPGASLCLGFFAGYVARDQLRTPTICLPRNYPLEEVTEDYLVWSAGHPEIANKKAWFALAAYLSRYPCKR